jgi:hypothetical protein
MGNLMGNFSKASGDYSSSADGRMGVYEARVGLSKLCSANVDGFKEDLYYLLNKKNITKNSRCNEIAIKK